MKIKISLHGGILSAAAAVMATLLAATPALAYDNRFHTDDGDPGGVLYWTQNGDVVKICDIEADGYAVRANVGVWDEDFSGGTIRYTISVGGNGNCKRVDASDGGVYNLPEKRWLGLNLWLYSSAGNLAGSSDHDDYYNG